MVRRGFIWGVVAVWLAASAQLARLHAQEPAEAQDPTADADVAVTREPVKSEPSPEAVAAKQAFDAVYKEYTDVLHKITEVRSERDAAEGDEKLKINDQLLKLRRDAEKVVDKIVDAGVAVYKAAPDGYPDINSTLLAMGQFYLIGDPNTGDGGDQYEKALPLAKALIDAGAGERWPQLYLWGAIAAIDTNEYELGEQYLLKAQETGALGGAGTSPRLMDLADGAARFLPQLKKNWDKEKEIRAAEAQADDLPRVKLTTTRGDVVIELFENEAPEAVANFISLVKQGFYNGVVFHRVLPGFMAQGGDPTGTGTGGPGYCIKCECYTPKYRRHFRGSLSMAHAGRDTGGSQFFLTFVPTTFLDGKHTVFGRVIEGMDIAASLRRRDPNDPATTPDMIVKAEVVRDRGHAYDFTKLPGR